MMTTVDAVVGAEAVLGRSLEPAEMDHLVTITKRGLGEVEKWDAILAMLGVKSPDIVRQALRYQLVIAANEERDYEKATAVLRDDAETRLKRAGWVR